MKILLIEDNKAIAKGLAFSLKTAGYETDISANCEQAYSMIGGDYAVMIIDITLPDGNGFDLYKDIRRVNSAPVIFLTALDDLTLACESDTLSLPRGVTAYVPEDHRALTVRGGRLILSCEA